MKKNRNNFFIKRKSSGLPVLSKMEIDGLAEGVLRRFDPGALRGEHVLDIDYLVERYLGWDMDFKYLSNCGVYLGMCVFRPGTIVPVYQPDSERVALLPEKGHTVIIDNSLLQKCQRHRYRFTVAHEAAHAFLHEPYFRNPGRLACEEAEPLLSVHQLESMRRPTYTLRTDGDWLEWQASTFGAAILMPRCMVQRLARSCHIMDGESARKLLPRVMTRAFDVSLEAARIRLDNLLAAYPNFFCPECKPVS